MIEPRRPDELSLTRKEVIHLVAHGIVSITAGVIVLFAGGPAWAVVMTFLIVWFE